MAKRKAFLMRIDPRLFDALQRWADDELRSVNGQVEYLLSQALRRSGRWPQRSPRATQRDSGQRDSQREDSQREGSRTDSEDR